MKKIIINSLLLLGAMNVQAQQDALISQYMFNGLFLNPAYAGSHDFYSATLTFRKQWVNFDGAPMTSIASVDGPIKGKNMGIGLIVMNDQIGVTRQNKVVANYSYQLKIGDKGKLALGLSAGASQYSARTSTLTVWDENDVMFTSDQSSGLIPRFGFGAYYFQEKWFAGISVPTLMAYVPNNRFSMNVNETFLQRHYLLNGGVILPVNDKIKVKPSMLFKYLPNAPLQVDVNFSVLIKDAVWVGTSFRSGDAVVALIEYQANNKFRVAYAYDITFSRIHNYSAGSHEILIGYDFGKSVPKVRTPRFF
jgi:type IX secretion system PorP/SprF family membrane protein